MVFIRIALPNTIKTLKIKSLIFISALLATLIMIGAQALHYNKHKFTILYRTIIYILEDFQTGKTQNNLLLGSSSIERLNSATHLNCGPWTNRGIGGSVIGDINRYIRFSPSMNKPSMILLYTGENDLANGMKEETVINNYINLLHNIRIKYPESTIHVLSIKPSPVRAEHFSSFIQTNNEINALSMKNDNIFFYLNNINSASDINGNYHFLSDRIHLTSHGYKEFTREFNLACKI